MLSLDMPVIVEGKYDKIKLTSLIDTLIIATNGFRIFKDEKSRVMIRQFAEKCGVIVLTDSDWAGKIIRNHIKSISRDGRVYNAYIPKIIGKEKRKKEISKEGILGVEGMEKETIIEAIKKSGALGGHLKRSNLKKSDLYLLGLSGRENSVILRKKLLQKYNLPDNLSSSDLIEYLNMFSDFSSLKSMVDEIKREGN